MSQTITVSRPDNDGVQDVVPKRRILVCCVAMGSQFLLACAPTKGYADTELASEKVALVRARSAENYFGEFVHVELTALEACRAVRATPGVTLSRFY
jgi:hypothetical protein